MLRTAIACGLVTALGVSAPADAARRTDCERPKSRTVIETGQLRVYEIARGSQKQGTRSMSTYACRKGSTRTPLLLFDDGDGPGALSGFVAAGPRVSFTSIGCDTTGFGCSSRATLLNLRTRRTLSGPAAPAGAKEEDWEAVRALPADSGVLVYSAQSPVNAGSATRPAVDGRIALVGGDRVVRELDRGADVEAESLAVAHRTGRPSLVTWRRGGVLKSAEV